ncbi:MAG: uracil-DNA glycosylase family protein [Flavobacteriaceae bacterium]|uniref:uracil-DNA glycosylase family protein n=1 Tax=Gelidibacter japonicus TaxID=1962232 RepID=UPI001DA4EEF6|nr:uracil-DNA glycosylase family protein [Flavobacteriaceae bacterium]
MQHTFDKLLKDIKKCQTCAAFLPNAPKPIVSVSPESKILVIGQAPGTKVHESDIPFNDKSGENLRDWLGVTKAQFYDTKLFGIVPMGFCFPGSNPKGGDLPPRKECAPQWHNALFSEMPKVELVLLIGQYAQKYYLGKSMKKNLTETVKYGYEYLPKYFPLVHPSPLNFRWQAKNPWFKTDVLPMLQKKVEQITHN